MPFAKKTLLVTGAGASKEVGFPVGGQLKENIRSLTNVRWSGIELTGDKEYCRLLEDLARTEFACRVEEIVRSCSHIHQNVILSGSIDQFLSSHQEDETLVRCAKLAIAYEIAKSERLSNLNFEKNSSRREPDFVYLKDTYFPRLWARIQNGLPIADWKSYFTNLRFITFNYDRTLEQFFTLALTRFCKAPPEQVAEFIRELPILHVYGSLGKLSGAQDLCPYGPNLHQIFDASKRDLTFSESLAENIRTEIQEYFGWANRIVFLGFSYANVNMDLFPQMPDSNKKVFGTSMGMSEHNSRHAQTRLNNQLSNINRGTEFVSGSCAQLFDDFELQLN